MYVCMYLYVCVYASCMYVRIYVCVHILYMLSMCRLET